MEIIHTLALYTHIIFGSASLILFWIAMTAPKGRTNHVKFGGFYHSAMYTVAISGAFTAVLVLWDPMTIHGSRLTDSGKQVAFISHYRLFFSLLLYLSVLVYAALRQGTLSLKYKQQPSKLQKPDVLLANITLIISAPALFYFGFDMNQKLPMIFSVLGLVSGMSNLRYAFLASKNSKAWLREHIGAMIGTGIGAHTAFFAFGGRTLLSGIGEWQMVFWIAPGIIGSIAIRHFTKKYAPENKASNSSLMRTNH